MKFIFVTLALVTLFVSTNVAEEYTIRKGTVNKCTLSNSGGQVVRYGSYCSAGNNDCQPNPC